MSYCRDRAFLLGVWACSMHVVSRSCRSGSSSNPNGCEKESLANSFLAHCVSSEIRPSYSLFRPLCHSLNRYHLNCCFANTPQVNFLHIGELLPGPQQVSGVARILGDQFDKMYGIPWPSALPDEFTIINAFFRHFPALSGTAFLRDRESCIQARTWRVSRARFDQ